MAPNLSVACPRAYVCLCMCVNVLSVNKEFLSFRIDATRALDETFRLKIELQQAGIATMHRDRKHSSGVEAWDTHTHTHTGHPSKGSG